MKRLETEIILEYDDTKTAKAIAKALSPDNLKTPNGLSVETISKKKRVLTRITCEGRLATFIATIDDLLFCASTAERILRFL